MLLASLIGKFLVFIGIPMFTFSHSKLLRNSFGNNHSTILLFSGIGPVFSLVVLNALLIFIPNQNSQFYILTLIVVSLIPVLQGITSIQTPSIKGSHLEKIFFLSSFIILCLVWMTLVVKKPLTEHDSMEYITQGQVFANDKMIAYSDYRYDEKTGFFYVGLHAFGYPLVRTLEVLSTNTLGNSDYYFFKSYAGLYGLLIILLFVAMLKDFQSNLAYLGGLTFIMTYGFIFSFLQFGIDHLRLFFLLGSFYIMLNLFKNPTTNSYLLMAVLIGFQSFIHSLGFILGIIQIGVIFLFMGGKIFERLKMFVMQTFVMLIFGGWHYPVDLIIGTGWILK